MTTPTLVRDLMTVGVPTCKASTPVLDVGRYILEHHIEEMVVLNEDGEGIGVCGYAELVALYGRDDLEALTAEAVMREGVPELPADIPLAVAATLLKDRGLRVAYMTHNSAGIIYPAAYISFWHILRALTAGDETALKDLGISAERQSPLDVFIERRDAARRKAGLS
jgi:CBS domain-containing protein